MHVKFVSVQTAQFILSFNAINRSISLRVGDVWRRDDRLQPQADNVTVLLMSVMSVGNTTTEW